MPRSGRNGSKPSTVPIKRGEAKLSHKAVSPPPPTHQHKLHDTPHGPKSSHPLLTRDWENTPELKLHIAAELDKPGAIIEGGPEYTTELFKGVVGEEKITSFLANERHYRNGRWSAIPVSTTREHDLYEPLKQLGNAIINYFSMERRKVEISFNTMLDHDSNFAINSNSIIGDDEEKEKMKSAPDLMFLGKGKQAGFKNSHFPALATYDACVSLLEVKQNMKKGLNNIIYQMALYCRQCFVRQENRKFVYCGLIDRTDIRIFQFDRSGVIYTDAVSYHDNPKIFVLWLCGLASDSLETVGFDKSIQWRGIANDGWLETPGLRPAIQLPQGSLLAQSNTLTGRGTICWLATWGRSGLILKQQWKHKDRTSEATFLEDLEGIKGVVQLISSEIGDCISAHRWVTQPHPFQDRQFVRLGIHPEGKTIENFPSQLGLLRCLRDAIKGHRNAWDAKILHRDIHPGNILLGVPDTLGGYEGVVADFDMAVYITRTESLSGHDLRTGDRTFQSMKTALNPHAPHDHLDDLESFFWVLLWICIKYEGPGARAPTPSNLLHLWSDENVRLGAFEKRHALEYFDDIVEPKIGHEFGPAVLTLIKDLSAVVLAKYRSRIQPYVPKDDGPATLEELCPDAHNDYEDYLAIIKRAIKKVKWEKRTGIKGRPRPNGPRKQSETRAESPNTASTANKSPEGAESEYDSSDPDTEDEVVESPESSPPSNAPLDATGDTSGSSPALGNEPLQVAAGAAVAIADNTESQGDDVESEGQSIGQTSLPTTPLPRTTDSGPPSRATSTTTAKTRSRKRQHSMTTATRTDKRSRTAYQAHTMTSSPSERNSVHPIAASASAVASTSTNDDFLLPITHLPGDFTQLGPILPSPSGAFLVGTNRTRLGAPRYGPVETGIASTASTVHSSPLRSRSQPSQVPPVSIALISRLASAFPNHIAGAPSRVPQAPTEPNYDVLIPSSSPLSSVPSSPLPDNQMGSLSPLSSLPPSSPSANAANRYASRSPWPDYNTDSPLSSVPMSPTPSNAATRAPSRRTSLEKSSSLSSIPEADEE